MNKQFDIQALKPDDALLFPLEDNLWLMDNHKWALLAWERHRQQAGGSQYSLIHADFHWDGGDDFSDDNEAQSELLTADLDKLKTMTEAEDLIRYDSFIAPALRRGLLSEVHFYCLQDDGNDVGLDEELLDQTGAQQFLHENIQDLAKAKPRQPLIFDLCLDLFNRSDDKEYQGDLWSDEEVVKFLDDVAHHIRMAELVTISLSFGYSGTEDDTRHLAKLVIPKIQALRANTRLERDQAQAAASREI
jgi:hypothetical protein